MKWLERATLAAAIVLLVLTILFIGVKRGRADVLRASSGNGPQPTLQFTVDGTAVPGTPTVSGTGLDVIYSQTASTPPPRPYTLGATLCYEGDCVDALPLVVEAAPLPAITTPTIKSVVELAGAADVRWKDHDHVGDPTGVRVERFEALPQYASAWVLADSARTATGLVPSGNERLTRVETPWPGCTDLRLYLAAEGHADSPPSNVVRVGTCLAEPPACPDDLDGDGGIGLRDVAIAFGRGDLVAVGRIFSAAARGGACPS